MRRSLGGIPALGTYRPLCSVSCKLDIRLRASWRNSLRFLFAHAQSPGILLNIFTVPLRSRAVTSLQLLGLYIGDHKWLPINYITKILGLLPALETLVLEGQYLVDPFVTCMEALTPMNAQETPGLNRSNWEGQISKVLCPRLETLQIEGISLTERPELMPVLKNIVTLRAVIGYPLKSFTFIIGIPKKSGS